MERYGKQKTNGTNDLWMKEYNGGRIEIKAVEDYKLLNSSYVCTDSILRITLKMQQYFHEELYITDFYAQFMLWNNFLCLPDPEISKGTKMVCLVGHFFLHKSCFATLFGC